MKHYVPAFLALCSVLLAGCGSATQAPARSTTATSQPAPAAELNIYNWDTYIDPAILADFEKQFDATINYKTFGAPGELMREVKADGSRFDIIVPSDYQVAAMRRSGMLAPLTKEHIPNFKNVDPIFINPEFDPGNRYCAPYQWGTLGIGYDHSATGDISGWEDVFDAKFAGRVALLDDERSSLGGILLYLGYSPNTTSQLELEQAQEFLIEHSAQIAAYAPDTGQQMLISDTVDLAMEWSGDVLQAMEQDSNIRYMLPEEGSIIWTDNICIPAEAQHKELAEKFINFILDAEVGARLSNFTHFSSPNKAALPHINKVDRRNPVLYPPKDVRERLFFISDVGPSSNKLYKELWTEVLEQHNSR